MPAVPGVKSDEELYASQIEALVSEHGEVPPPWAYYPRVHPFDIHWRMGAGEDYRYLFAAWARSRQWSSAERVAYITRWDPPFSWLHWVAKFLWPEDFPRGAEQPSDEHFARMEGVGFGSRADWNRCGEVDPDAYPLPDDTSSRWLERTTAHG